MGLFVSILSQPCSDPSYDISASSCHVSISLIGIKALPWKSVHNSCGKTATCVFLFFLCTVCYGSSSSEDGVLGNRRLTALGRSGLPRIHPPKGGRNGPFQNTRSAGPINRRLPGTTTQLCQPAEAACLLPPVSVSNKTSRPGEPPVGALYVILVLKQKPWNGQLFEPLL